MNLHLKLHCKKHKVSLQKNHNALWSRVCIRMDAITSGRNGKFFLGGGWMPKETNGNVGEFQEDSQYSIRQSPNKQNKAVNFQSFFFRKRCVLGLDVVLESSTHIFTLSEGNEQTHPLETRNITASKHEPKALSPLPCVTNPSPSPTPGCCHKGITRTHPNSQLRPQNTAHQSLHRNWKRCGPSVHNLSSKCYEPFVNSKQSL